MKTVVNNTVLCTWKLLQQNDYQINTYEIYNIYKIIIYMPKTNNHIIYQLCLSIYNSFMVDKNISSVVKKSEK